jgi:hypothetical protein
VNCQRPCTTAGCTGSERVNTSFQIFLAR